MQIQIYLLVLQNVGLCICSMKLRTFTFDNPCIECKNDVNTNSN